MLYIHESFNAMLCASLSSYDYNDSVWCIIKLSEGINMLIGVVYRSPNSSKENDDKLLKLLTSTTELAGILRILITGDFNVPEITYSTRLVHGITGSYQVEFFDHVSDLFLHQHVLECT
jgi:hypothetical protein